MMYWNVLKAKKIRQKKFKVGGFIENRESDDVDQRFSRGSRAFRSSFAKKL